MGDQDQGKPPKRPIRKKKQVFPENITEESELDSNSTKMDGDLNR
jgi:hypothetical protein